MEATIFILEEEAPDRFNKALWEEHSDWLQGASIHLPYMPVIGWHISVSDSIEIGGTPDEDFIRELQYRSPDFKIEHILITPNGLCLYLKHSTIYPKTKSIKSSVLDRAVDSLDISVRLRNVINRLGATTVNDIVNIGIDGFKKDRNFGNRSQKELVELMEDLEIPFS